MTEQIEFDELMIGKDVIAWDNTVHLLNPTYTRGVLTGYDNGRDGGWLVLSDLSNVSLSFSHIMPFGPEIMPPIVELPIGTAVVGWSFDEVIVGKLVGTWVAADGSRRWDVTPLGNGEVYVCCECKPLAEVVDDWATLTNKQTNKGLII